MKNKANKYQRIKQRLTDIKSVDRGHSANYPERLSVFLLATANGPAGKR
jgi:hypothetical protein